MRIHKLIIPTPFPVGPINIYLIAEDPITLIDTGPKTDEAIAALTFQIKQFGFRIEDIQRIILTHTHEDHCGLANWLQQISGAPVYVHEWERSNLAERGKTRINKNLLEKIGVTTEELNQMEQHYAQVKSYAEAVENLKTYRDEHEFEFASGSLSVVHTPGHTPGSSCLWRAATRTLIAGDTVLKTITPNPVLNIDPKDNSRRFPALINYLKSIIHLQTLAPTLIHTSHGDDVSDFDEYVSRLRKHTYNRQTKVLSLIPSEGINAHELAFLLFPKVSDASRFLAVSETIAHLDLAVSEENLRMEIIDGSEHFFRFKN
jgi:glyoxylase-like metal-dependent hydrolase (beta-lactamase superfamily II)